MRAPILFLVTFLVVFITPLHTIHSSTDPQMDVHYINVGQGDSILIETPENKVILIDGGPPEAGKKIVSYLKEQQIKKIDLLIATHPDIDHIGGLPHIMNAFEVSYVLDSGKLHMTKAYSKYINKIRKLNIPVQIAKEGEFIDVDDQINIHVLNTYERSKNNNQSSIVLKVSFQEIDFLFMGDAEEKQEKRLMDKYNLEADIIKVGHHGSNTSSTLDFLRAVNPRIALITYSKKNDYGHPVNRVIENLEKVKAQIYSTAVFGNITIKTNGNSFFILQEKGPVEGLVETIS